MIVVKIIKVGVPALHAAMISFDHTGSNPDRSAFEQFLNMTGRDVVGSPESVVKAAETIRRISQGDGDVSLSPVSTVAAHVNSMLDTIVVAPDDEVGDWEEHIIGKRIIPLSLLFLDPAVDVSGVPGLEELHGRVNLSYEVKTDALSVAHQMADIIEAKFS